MTATYDYTLAQVIQQIEQEWPHLQGQVVGDTQLSELDIDSLDLMVAVVNAETQFRIVIPNHALDTIETPADLARAVVEAQEAGRHYTHG